MPNTLPPPPREVGLTPEQLNGARQRLASTFEPAMPGFDSERQERETRERFRIDLESHISRSFDVTTSSGYEQASAYVRHEMNRTRHEVTTLELRMSDVQARRLRLTDELSAHQPPSETREAIAEELRSMTLTVRELTNKLEELRSLGARLQIQRQQQHLQEFMTAGRDPRQRQFPFLQDNRPSPPLATDPPNAPLSSPVFAPTLLPPIDLPAHVTSEARPARVSNVFRRIYQDRSALDPMPLLQNPNRDTSRQFTFEYPITPVNDENDPGSIATSSRQPSSSSRSIQRRPSDRVPLSQLDDSVEENDDRYLNEMLPPSQRPTTSANVIAPQGSPAEVEAMLMAMSDEDDVPRFDSRNARRRQFRTRSPAMVMRTRITGEQHALSLSEPPSREERLPGSPFVPGGRPTTPLGPPVLRRPPLELRGAGTPVQDVEMLDTSPALFDPFVVPPSTIVRDPHMRLPMRPRRWYPQEEPDDLPPLEDTPSWPAVPFSPHTALNGYMTGENPQPLDSTWDSFWDPDATTGPPRFSLAAVRNAGRGPPKEYVRPAGKSIREWVEERETALAAESSGCTRPARSLSGKAFPDEEGR